MEFFSLLDINVIQAKVLNTIVICYREGKTCFELFRQCIFEHSFIETHSNVFYSLPLPLSKRGSTSFSVGTLFQDKVVG